MKQLKDVISLSIGEYGGAAIGAGFWFLLAMMISAEEYGELHYFLGIAGLAFGIALLGTQDTVTVYTAKNVKLAPTLFLISLIAGGIAAVIIALMFSRLDSSFLVLGLIINDLAIGYILGKKLFSRYTTYFLLQKSLTFGLGLLAFYLFGVEGILFAIALSYSHFLIIVALVFKNNPIDFSLIKKHGRFISNNYFMSVAGIVRNQVDKIIIAPLVGFEILGNYALTFQIYLVLLIFSNIIYRYSLPQDSSGENTKKVKIIGLSYAAIVTVLGLTVLPIIVPFVFEGFDEVGQAIQIMSLSIIPTTITLFYTSKFLGKENSGIILVGRIIQGGTTIVALLILAPIYGIIGATSAFVISSIFICIFLVITDYYKKSIT